MVHAEAPWWALCRPEVHYLYLFHIYTPPSIASAKNRPKMDLFVVGTSLQVRATSGLLFGLIDTMGAVDSGAITPHLWVFLLPLGSGESLY